MNLPITLRDYFENEVGLPTQSYQSPLSKIIGAQPQIIENFEVMRLEEKPHVTPESLIAIILAYFNTVRNESCVISRTGHTPLIWSPPECIPTYGVCLTYYGTHAAFSVQHWNDKPESVVKDLVCL